MNSPNHRKTWSRTPARLVWISACLAIVAALRAQETVLFIGNSFLYAARSPVQFYRAQTVTDLNGEGHGGVPALFKAFSEQARLNYRVSLETIPGSALDEHLQKKAGLIVRPWDHVLLLGHSLLDLHHPGDPGLLVSSARQLSAALHGQNPHADIRLIATWARPDQVYPTAGHWHGRTLAAMANDVRKGNDLALANSPFIHNVIPVGQAWDRAMVTGIAALNPYESTAPSQINLWAYDNHHASAFGYYLEALVVFGDLTGLDPRSLSKNERCAFELGFSPRQTVALQQVAFDQLSAEKARAPLKVFTPPPPSVAELREQSSRPKE